MEEIKLVDDLEVIEGSIVHVTVLIGENEYIVHLGVDLDRNGYEIGYIDERLKGKEGDFMEKFIELNKRGILNLIREEIKEGERGYYISCGDDS